MGGARDVGWVAAGLVLAAGACYCIYRLTRGQRRGARRVGLRPSRSAEDLTNGSYDDILNAEQLQKLLYLLESTEDPVIIEKALVTLGNNAAFSANQVIIRELGGITIVGSQINNPNQSIKEKALNALNNLSVNVENQIKIKVYVNQVCEDVLSGPLNSAVQLAGLRLLTNMTVTNDHQHMLSTYIADLFHVLLTGNGSTKLKRRTRCEAKLQILSFTESYSRGYDTVIIREPRYGPGDICSETFLCGLSPFPVARLIWMWSMMYPDALTIRCNNTGNTLAILLHPYLISRMHTHLSTPFSPGSKVTSSP